jgi:deoxyribose-phosphate aldolase
VQPNAAEIARFIDHTILKPETTSGQVLQTCNEAKTNGFFGVCVNSAWLPLTAKALTGSSVIPVAVIGFPLGAMSSEVKAMETRWCVQHGAEEIDMVISIGLLKEKNDLEVEQDIAGVVIAADGRPVKVILETALLSEEEKTRACLLAVKAGASFVKTCTGFGGGAATVEDISLMRRIVGPKIGVKASGGVKNLEQAQSLIAAGASRIGTSSGVLIVQGLTSKSGY